MLLLLVSLSEALAVAGILHPCTNLSQYAGGNYGKFLENNPISLCIIGPNIKAEPG